MQVAVDKSIVRIDPNSGYFRVFVDVDALDAKGLVKVCQNFVKYEDVVDRIASSPPSRDRTRASGADSTPRCVAASNRESVGLDLTNRGRHDRIGDCDTVPDLCSVMNDGGCGGRKSGGGRRAYKLDLRRLLLPLPTATSSAVKAEEQADNAPDEEGRERSGNGKRTIVFRQHFATSDKDQAKNWVRFCVSFVVNSARLKPPLSSRETTSVDERFNMMFEYVVKDRRLRDYYRPRFLSSSSSSVDDAVGGGDNRGRRRDKGGGSAVGKERFRDDRSRDGGGDPPGATTSMSSLSLDEVSRRPRKRPRP